MDSHPVNSASVNAFLSSYVAAFNSCDGPAIASHYNFPSLSLRGDGSLSILQEPEAAAVFFASMSSAYCEQGCADWKWSVEDLQEIGSQSAIVAVNWSMLKADRSVLRSWRHSYNLIASGGELRILLATFNAP